MSLVDKIASLPATGVGRHLLSLYEKEHGITDELVEAWISFSNISDNQMRLGEDLMWDIIALSQQVTNPAHLLELYLIEAHLKLMHEDTQVAWEALEYALYLAPEDERIHAFLMELNCDPEEAPLFEDGMERIAEQVAQGLFPGRVFKRLLRTLANPEDPGKYKMAIYLTAN